jgi:glutamate formiminotransferase
LTLLAIPNVSEGRGRTAPDAVAAITASGGRLLDLHSDADHNRTVYTFTADDVIEPMLALAKVAVEQVDLRTEPGLHPHVGALDVAPIVYLDDGDRGRACATALVLADRLGCELGLPAFIYGELAGGLTRASLRRGGLPELANRVAAGRLKPDFGPRAIELGVGATLVGARPPLIAFNAELAPPAAVEEARAIAVEVRKLPGVRAIGLWLTAGGRAQVSMNIEDYAQCSPAEAVAAIERFAPVEQCELVGLAPRAAFADFPHARMGVRNMRLLEDVL